ncbi:uncharacterized protein LOC106180364 [Lingula anatina]|uniref:Uncharacterized protein LOC106180364 n=1 Tax=Lingula anatina TaxID=7574 RepID=A0A1S3KC06_LINAN|nr:uncharacterized protein LOC106180364 [Lingula anatina]|eukprot:XP_013419791.1 uncharacterized protein LOC106180364 [Lingula anatina]
MKVLCVAVLCLVATFASAKSLDERVARMLMEDEEFKRGLKSTVCNAIENVINNFAPDLIKFGCNNVDENAICGLVVNAVGGYFGATKATCKLIIPDSLMKSLQNQCRQLGSFNNVNVC